MTSKQEKNFVPMACVKQGQRFIYNDEMYIMGEVTRETFCEFQAHGHNEVSRYNWRDVFACWNVYDNVAVNFAHRRYCNTEVVLVPESKGMQNIRLIEGHAGYPVADVEIDRADLIRKEDKHGEYFQVIWK